MNISRLLPRFCRDEDGNVTVEFVIALPVLLALVALSFETFDAFKGKSRAEKASYVVSDIVSRRTTFDQAVADDLLAVLNALMPRQTEQKSLRFSNLAYDEDNGFQVIWSYAAGGAEVLTNDMLTEAFVADLPALETGETVVITDVSIPHDSLVDWFGLGDLVWTVEQNTRPRFVACITDGTSACSAVDDMLG